MLFTDDGDGRRDELRSRLQEYESVRAETRSIIQGGDTLGVITVAVGAGELAVSLEFRREALIALPPLMLIMAASSGLQYAFITYLAEVARRLEDRINALVGPAVLQWGSRLSTRKLPWPVLFNLKLVLNLELVLNPMLVFEFVMVVVLLVIYAISAVAGGYMLVIAMDDLKAPFDRFSSAEWRWAAGVMYWTGHLIGGAAVISLYFGAGAVIRWAMKRVPTKDDGLDVLDPAQANDKETTTNTAEN